MRRLSSWSPYAGTDAIVLAIILLGITGLLVVAAIRLRRPISVKRPGASMGIAIVVMWLLSVITFLVALTVYVQALVQQVGRFTGPANPITPVTMLSAGVSFFAILLLARRSGFWAATGSAIVGTIAAPMIFELPFDNIVMWRTYPPSPATLFTLLFFLPLFLVEISSFAMLMLSPLATLSRLSLLLLAGMFFVFAVWALFGFAYPAAPFPIAMNMVSKVLAFAVAVSLFLPQGSVKRGAGLVLEDVEAQVQSPHASGLA